MEKLFKKLMSLVLTMGIIFSFSGIKANAEEINAPVNQESVYQAVLEKNEKGDFEGKVDIPVNGKVVTSAVYLTRKSSTSNVVDVDVKVQSRNYLVYGLKCKVKIKSTSALSSKVYMEKSFDKRFTASSLSYVWLAQTSIPTNVNKVIVEFTNNSVLTTQSGWLSGSSTREVCTIK